MQHPSFDTWTIIFLFAAVQGLFVSAVLLFKFDRHPSRKILASITFLFSIILIAYVGFWTRYEYYYPYLTAFPDSIYYLFGPLFYLYFESIFTKKKFVQRDLLHFIPAFLVLLWSMPFILMSIPEKQAVMSGHLPVPKFSLPIVWIGIAQMCAYQFLIYRKFSSLSRTNPEVRKWFVWLSGLFSGFIFSYLSYYILANFRFFNTSWDYAISFSMTFFIFFVAWFGYMQPKVFCGFSVFEEKPKYRNSPISADVSGEIIGLLEKNMQEKKYFLQSDLSLDKLSALTDTNKHYLSQAINENLGMNFFEYINSLRINEAKELLASREKLTIIEVAYQAGYNNKVSFNKAFKSIVGITPGEFRSKNKVNP